MRHFRHSFHSSSQYALYSNLKSCLSILLWMWEGTQSTSPALSFTWESKILACIRLVGEHVHWRYNVSTILIFWAQHHFLNGTTILVSFLHLWYFVAGKGTHSEFLFMVKICWNRISSILCWWSVVLNIHRIYLLICLPHRSFTNSKWFWINKPLVRIASIFKHDINNY